MTLRKAGDELPHVLIYSDGACEPNPGPGGWAAVLKFADGVQDLAGAEPDTTNNRMELRAAIEGLRALKAPSRVDLYTDSEYLRRGVTEWMDAWLTRRKKPANWDLWQELLAAAKRHTITWHWVRGHAGNAFNERAHRLAGSKLAASGRF